MSDARCRDIAHEVFAPTAGEVATAQAAIDATSAAEGAGAGAANLGGLLIDAATSRIFQGVLDHNALFTKGN